MAATLTATAQIPQVAAVSKPSHSKPFNIVATLANMEYATLDPWATLAWSIGDTAAGATPAHEADLANESSGGAAMFDSYALTGAYPLYSVIAKVLQSPVAGAAGRELWIGVMDGGASAPVPLLLVKSLGIIQA